MKSGTIAWVRFPAITVVALESSLAGGLPGQQVQLAKSTDTIIATVLFDLDDGDRSILARPLWIEENDQREFMVVDFSDRDIKIYDDAGQRLRTVGQAGHGPGKFAALTSAVPMGRGIQAYDFEGSWLVTLDKVGTEIARVQLTESPQEAQPVEIRAIGDELLLVIYQGGHGKDVLLHVVKPSGGVVRRFFELNEWHGSNPDRPPERVIADGHRGCIFVGTTGGDSVRVFSEDGNRIAAGVIRPRRLEAESGKVRLRSVVALPGCKAIAQVTGAPDSTEPLDGGVAVLLRADADGYVSLLAEVALAAGVIGRSATGDALAIQRLGQSAPYFRVIQLVSGESKW